jgi:hypothetical protein
MKDLDQKIVAWLHPLFGAFLGFLVFTFGTGGWWFVFTGKVRSKWVGPMGLIISLGVGAILGWIAYRHRQREFSGVGELAQDEAGAFLLGKRIVVIITCLVALYFLWQLAKSI